MGASFPVSEVPSHRFEARSTRRRQSRPPFEFEEHDRAAVEETFGGGLIKTETIEVSRTYAGGRLGLSASAGYVTP